jgi:hypothetical protein
MCDNTLCCTSGIGSDGVGFEQMVMTASILYEAVEPHVVWKQLLTGIADGITGDGNVVEVRGYSEAADC